MAGCAVGPNYRRPPIDPPVATRGQVRPAEAASIADLPWWQVFEDPVLQQLVATAIRENYDLKKPWISHVVAPSSGPLGSLRQGERTLHYPVTMRWRCDGQRSLV